MSFAKFRKVLVIMFSIKFSCPVSFLHFCSSSRTPIIHMLDFLIFSHNSQSLSRVSLILFSLFFRLDNFTNFFYYFQFAVKLSNEYFIIDAAVFSFRISI